MTRRVERGRSMGGRWRLFNSRKVVVVRRRAKAGERGDSTRQLYFTMSDASIRAALSL